MKIQPVYTLMINDGEEYINAETEVKVKRDNDKEYDGLFLSCDDYGIDLEIGAENSCVIYIPYSEIINIEER